MRVYKLHVNKFFIGSDGWRRVLVSAGSVETCLITTLRLVDLEGSSDGICMRGKVDGAEDGERVCVARPNASSLLLPA